MTGHELAKLLLALPDLPVISHNYAVTAPVVRWRHAHDYNWGRCQGDTEIRPTNCYSCNIGLERREEIVL